MQIKLANFFQNNSGSEPKNNPETETGRARAKIAHSIQAQLNEQRTISERVADILVHWFGSFEFVIANFIFFLVWIIFNAGFIPGAKPFDPFPFIFLTMIVSLEAIFLSIFVLTSQNRESRISDLREEIDIQINMIAEQEITKAIHLLSYLMKHLNVPYEKDPELKRMMKPLDMEEIRRELEQQLNLSSKSAK